MAFLATLSSFSSPAASSPHSASKAMEDAILPIKRRTSNNAAATAADIAAWSLGSVPSPASHAPEACTLGAPAATPATASDCHRHAGALASALSFTLDMELTAEEARCVGQPPLLPSTCPVSGDMIITPAFVTAVARASSKARAALRSTAASLRRLGRHLATAAGFPPRPRVVVMLTVSEFEHTSCYVY